MDIVLEFLRFVFITVFGAGVTAFMMFAIIASSYEISARRKAWKAGTHDYYGNKLEDHE